MADVFDMKGKPRHDVLKQHLILEGRLEDDAVLRLISYATDIFRLEPTLIEVPSPVTSTTFYIC